MEERGGLRCRGCRLVNAEHILPLLFGELRVVGDAERHALVRREFVIDQRLRVVAAIDEVAVNGRGTQRLTVGEKRRNQIA